MHLSLNILLQLIVIILACVLFVTLVNKMLSKNYKRLRVTRGNQPKICIKSPTARIIEFPSARNFEYDIKTIFASYEVQLEFEKFCEKKQYYGVYDRIWEGLRK